MDEKIKNQISKTQIKNQKYNRTLILTVVRIRGQNE